MRALVRDTDIIHRVTSARKADTFRRFVYTATKECGRSFPWRDMYALSASIRAYRVLISEIMLQQTQADRVAPKYQAFIKSFPSVRSLAQAPLSDVLVLWQGLGYNRRARALHEAARLLVEKHKGVVPRSREVLQSFPGIGPYTAAAVRVFAFNEPDIVIETNIRTVFIHHFFQNQDNITDRELMPFVEATLDRSNPRRWYSALMDYGAALKKTKGNLARRSHHYTKQTPFVGSSRQLRGAIIRELSSEEALTPVALSRRLGRERAAVTAQLEQLLKERMVAKTRQRYALPR